MQFFTGAQQSNNKKETFPNDMINKEEMPDEISHASPRDFTAMLL